MRPALSAIAESVSAFDTPTPRPLGARPVALLVSRYPAPAPTAALHEHNELERLGQPGVVLALHREGDGGRLSPLRALARGLATRRATLLDLAADVVRDAARPHGVARLTWLAGLPRAIDLAEQAERLGVTHVHASGGRGLALTAYAVHRLSGVPFSVTLGADDLDLPAPVLEAAAFVRCRWEAHRRALAARHPALEGRARVIRAAVGPPSAEPPRAVAGRLVCVGPIDERGGHLTLVAGCLRLRRRGLDFACEMVGDGPLRTRVEAAIDGRGLQGQVRVLGARDDAERRVDEAAVVVHAGLHAGESRDAVWLPLLRAVSARRAIVIADGPAARELVEDGVSGVLVPAGDPDALADALERLLRQPEVARWLGEQARRKAGREFDLARSGRQLVEALRA